MKHLIIFIIVIYTRPKENNNVDNMNYEQLFYIKIAYVISID